MNFNEDIDKLIERLLKTLSSPTVYGSPNRAESYASAVKDLAEAKYYLDGGSSVNLIK